MKKVIVLKSRVIIFDVRYRYISGDIKAGSVYNETALALWDAQRDWIR